MMCIISRNYPVNASMIGSKWEPHWRIQNGYLFNHFPNLSISLSFFRAFYNFRGDFFLKKKISICYPFFPIKDIKSANSSVDCADGNPTSTLKHFLGLSTEKEVEELWDEESLKHFSCTFWCSHKLQKLWWSKHSSLLDNP